MNAYAGSRSCPRQRRDIAERSHAASLVLFAAFPRLRSCRSCHRRGTRWRRRLCGYFEALSCAAARSNTGQPSGVNQPFLRGLGKLASRPGWRDIVPAEFTTAAAVFPVGWITNQDTVPQCDGAAGCHGPVTGRSKRVVRSSQFKRPADSTAAPSCPTPILPVCRRTTDMRLGCGAIPGGESSLVIWLALPKAHSGQLTISVCFGADATVAQADVTRMLDTAQYNGASPS